MEHPEVAGAGGIDADVRLRARWSRHSRATGWQPRDEWWTPAVDAVCRAAVTGDRLDGVCGRLGRARARAGVPVAAALDDLAALCDVLDWPAPPMELVKALAEGWASAETAPKDCRDPLTGLATAAYLRTRLGELYQAATPDRPVPRTHRLLVVALDPAVDPWRRAARMIVLGHDLRRYFTRGESLALLTRERIGIVARLTPDLPIRAGTLRDRLRREHAAAVWSTALPPSYAEALDFLTDVGRPPSGD
ncbi:hypothetical protein DEF23_11290 [Marinitenerispora sediminis]|uniref:Uncharacterized protein n=1 Tax=Marinitenerispora sediminis TaxID=1931232 RepID=A0A368T7Z4_9ACTN|nr:hypothetical protein DEF28_15715 [Marinitenerispora sediminis]RCV57198.1 hypothetical protein DEF23_11290 [Marinitenerispora sediminis]RCV60321.1 hypothetical protein DEF24_07410 [Marinitenerispora sediminis]